MANPPLQTPPVRVRVLNVCGEGKARPSGRNPQAEAKSPPEKLADKTVQPLARQIATATISKTAADPLSANVVTLENPKWFAATIPVEKRTLRRHRVERRHYARVHRFTAAASANSIAFPPHKDSATKPMAAQMVQMYNIYQTRERTSRRERKKQENQMFLSFLSFGRLFWVSEVAFCWSLCTIYRFFL